MEYSLRVRLVMVVAIFLTCEDYGGRFDESSSACGFLFERWRSAGGHQFPCFRPNICLQRLRKPR